MTDAPAVEQPIAAEPDRCLLDRFVATRDEAAFTELVRRHGQLVWGVCRRRLARREDAEDAFQATFLILAAKSRSIRTAEALPGWLHRTACRAAIRVASAAPAAAPADMPATGADAFTELARYEAAIAVDDELQRLPCRSRDVLVLFYLQEIDRKEVAARLGISEATVKALLARGRTLLRTRLARRGLAIPAVLPFLADPVSAAAADSARRLGLTLTRGGVTPFDLISVPLQGTAPMAGWLIGKTTIAAGLLGAACLTLFLASPDHGDARSASAADQPDTVLATAPTDSKQPAPTIGVAPTPVPPISVPPTPSSNALAAKLSAGLPIEPSTPVEERIHAALEESAELNFASIPLRDAILFLAQTHAINIVIDEQALSDAGVELSEPVDYALKDITLKSGLNVLFNPFDITYLIEDDVLKITTRNAAAAKFHRFAYDVAGVPGSESPEFASNILKLVGPRVGPPFDEPTYHPPTVAVVGDRLLVGCSQLDREALEEVIWLLQAGRK